MALSMDEERILAEIESRLTSDDPKLAVRLSTLGEQRRPARQSSHSLRLRILAGLCALLVAALIAGLFVLALRKPAKPDTTLYDAPASSPAAVVPDDASEPEMVPRT
ncbi:MAG: DUF3040 domain-containing protein [Streptosporangiales bacterium]|nr:DUF3040 domain-containing protein [Streptosporangiales bacterium]